jgi:hypothetical protein
MKYRKYPNWVFITNKEIPFPYTIMGMPFLQQHEVKLDTANGTIIFGKHHDYTIRCNETQSAAILVTAAAGTNEETVTLPDFTKEFPNVFPEREPEGLPP